jgi:hypothetical protein
MRLISSTIAIGFAVVLAVVLPPRGATAADTDEQVAIAADQAFLAALARHDNKTAAAMLHPDLSWITAEGELLARAGTVAALGTVAASAKQEADVQRHFYGRLATVRGAHDGMRFLRVWAQAGRKWWLFAMIDTPVVPSERASVEAQQGGGECDNPCRTVPFKPKTAMDKAILATWQETKMIEWKPNAAAWARDIGEEFMIVNNTTIRTRAEREVIARRQEASGVGTPGDPILTMSIRDFGKDAAVMLSRHVPVRGGKPYNNIRVWVLRDNRWQLTISQQSQIKSAAPLPAVAQK